MDGYIDLALSPDEIQEQQIANTPLAEAPKYPYGTSITLDEKVLEKINVDYSDWKVGDIFSLDVLVKITSISENETQDSKRCCVNLQITALKGEEDEEFLEEEESEPSLEAHGYLRYK